MGWLIRYIGPDDDVIPPGRAEPEPVHAGDHFDVQPTRDVRAAVDDPLSPWQRISPADADYIAPGDR